MNKVKFKRLYDSLVITDISNDSKAENALVLSFDGFRIGTDVEICRVEGLTVGETIKLSVGEGDLLISRDGLSDGIYKISSEGSSCLIQILGTSIVPTFDAREYLKIWRAMLSISEDLKAATATLDRYISGYVTE